MAAIAADDAIPIPYPQPRPTRPIVRPTPKPINSDSSYTSYLETVETLLYMLINCLPVFHCGFISIAIILAALFPGIFKHFAEPLTF